MRPLTLPLLFSLLLVPSGLSLPSLFRKDPIKYDSHRQEPIMNIPNILRPPSNDKDGSSRDPSDLSISDVIGKERIINIFAGFTRDIDSISKRLNDGSQNTTVLAPLNSALQKLPRKPYVMSPMICDCIVHVLHGKSHYHMCEARIR